MRSNHPIRRNRLSNSDLVLEPRAMLAGSLTEAANSPQPESIELASEDDRQPSLSGETSPAVAGEESDAQLRERRARNTRSPRNETPRSQPVATTVDLDEAIDPETVEPLLADNANDIEDDSRTVPSETLTSETLTVAGDDANDVADGNRPITPSVTAPSDQPAGDVSTADDLAAPQLETPARPTNNAAAIDADTPEDARVTRPDQDDFELVYSDEFNNADRRKWSATNRDTNDRATNYPDSEGNRRDFRRRWRASNLSIDEAEGALNVQTKLTNNSPTDDTQILAGSRYVSRDAFKPSDADGGAIHIEARVRFPRAQGPHTAFWLLPPNGNLNPLSDDLTGADGTEIDIFEANAQLQRPTAAQQRNIANIVPEPDGTRRLPSGNEVITNNAGQDLIVREGTVRTGFHINGYNSVPSNVNAASRHREHLPTGQDDIYDQWQTVGITWSEDELKFYWEGQEFYSEDNPRYIPEVAQQILFSSQITSPSFGADLPDDLRELDDQGLEVDWVRVFHQNADSASDPVNTPAQQGPDSFA